MESPGVLVVGETPSLGRSIADLLESGDVPGPVRARPDQRTATQRNRGSVPRSGGRLQFALLQYRTSVGPRRAAERRIGRGWLPGPSGGRGREPPRGSPPALSEQVPQPDPKPARSHRPPISRLLGHGRSSPVARLRASPTTGVWGGCRESPSRPSPRGARARCPKRRVRARRAPRASTGTPPQGRHRASGGSRAGRAHRIAGPRRSGHVVPAGRGAGSLPLALAVIGDEEGHLRPARVRLGADILSVGDHRNQCRAGKFEQQRNPVGRAAGSQDLGGGRLRTHGA